MNTIRSTQLEVSVHKVVRDLDKRGGGRVDGSKKNRQRSSGMANGYSLFSVWFRNDDPVLVDGCGRPHPKLVLAAARAAWQNRTAVYAA